jgi:hypothetical protein
MEGAELIPRQQKSMIFIITPLLKNKKIKMYAIQKFIG